MYYFHHPKKITGDIPPTPFLTKKMESIARRFLIKGWLVEAFDRLRVRTRMDGQIFPADLMSPPDIHGEFLPASFYAFTPDGFDWKSLVERAISSTTDNARELAEVLGEGSELDLTGFVDTAEILAAIDSSVTRLHEIGLAHTLAERGHLPMYGMPTRVRDLYLGLRRTSGQWTWSTVDRDLILRSMNSHLGRRW